MKGKGKVRGFFKEFKAFISRGNILDMAVGVIIGSAFSAIVTAFTNKIIQPLINWVLSLAGGNGLESAYTFLKFIPSETDPSVADLTKSIYIDWGAFITAILDFLIIAFTLFCILKVAMNASGYLKGAQASHPTREERKVLKEQGVNMKDYKAVVAATAELREKNKPAPVEPKPTQEELLTGILEELKKQNQPAAAIAESAAEVEKPKQTKPKKTTKSTKETKVTKKSTK
jgi:large conductance mechanosensitive channel